jgi:hypothetical protein
MSSGHIVAIKLTPYLKDFCIKRYGPGEPIKATTTNKIFTFLKEYLTPKPKKWKPPVPGEDVLLVELPYNDEVNVRCHNYINPRNNAELKSFFYGMFYAAFVTYMNEKVIGEGWQVKYAIINFMDLYDISYKANYDSLKRLYYRYRFPESEKSKENLKKSLTTFQADSDHIRHRFYGVNEVYYGNS